MATEENTNNEARSTGSLDPLVTLKALPSKTAAASSITSLCFIGGCRNGSATPSAPDVDSDDEENDLFEAHFRQSRKALTSSSPSSSVWMRDRLNMDGVRLATCDFEGNALIWDVGRSKVVGNILDNRGTGLSLRRVDGDSSRLLYHTRDAESTVSLHDVEREAIVTQFVTHSHTLCAASPCLGDAPHLVALPSEQDSSVAIRDWRLSPESSPVAFFHGAGSVAKERQHGMLTSVAMWCGTTSTNLVLCGMEDGSLFFHDWRRTTTSDNETKLGNLTEPGYVSLGKDPILSLDVASSPVPPSGAPSLVALAGLAGDTAELNTIPEPERGRIAVVKASWQPTDGWQPRERARLGTCSLQSAGKPGVSVCRFRPDGRAFAAGGWDKRIRIFRRDGAALAVLRGHEKGIQAIDWAPDALESGLLASGSSDGRVCVWRCYGTI
jgi:WD40 repeat protein